MRLLLDECAGDRALFQQLLNAGHDVERSVDTVGGAASDPDVFAYAVAQNRISVTYNVKDFLKLASGTAQHPGLFVIRCFGDNTKNMKVADIVAAIGRVDGIYPGGLVNQVIELNGV